MKYFSFLLYISACFISTAQTPNFSIFSEPYVEISGEKLPNDTEENWSFRSASVDIGFPIYFQESPYTQLIIDYEGVIGFSDWCVDSIEGFQKIEPTIYTFLQSFDDRYWNDFEASELLSSIQYDVNYLNNENVLTLQWTNVSLACDPCNEHTFFNFQLKLYEKSPFIDIHVGPYSLKGYDTTNTPLPPLVMLAYDINCNNPNLPLGKFALISGDPNNPTYYPDYQEDIFNDFLNGFPDENTVYRFGNISTSINLAKPEKLSISNLPNGLYQLPSIPIDHFEVFDINGRTIQVDLQANLNQFSIPNPKGVFIVSILSNGTQYTKKIIR